MSVIIDANVASLFFAVPCHEDFRCLAEWIDCGDGKLVFGGKLQQELFKLAEARRRIIGWWRAGRAYQIEDPELNEQSLALQNAGICLSQDYHVLALAIVTRVRLLCSHGRNLHADFRNSEIINRPRGHVYQNQKQNHLFKHTAGCPGRRRS